MDVVELARELMAIPSVTGAEGAVCQWVVERLRASGWHVVTQEVPPEGEVEASLPRLNVLALSHKDEPPDVVLTTHLDTVPPHIELSEDPDSLYGRGACDAKGIFAAQWVAAERLRSKGARNIALLGLVGEETESRGAKMVHEILPAARWLIDGEPTGLVMASGAKGILAFDVVAKGSAAHSAYPERGHSAIHDLVSALDRLIQADLPSRDEYGETTVNVGTISGGLAGNVLAPRAAATVVVRLAAPSSVVIPVVEEVLSNEVEFHLRSRSEPHHIFVPEGWPGSVVRFGSDVPYLANIGTPLLVGPGSIHDAHTKSETIKKADLEEAVDLYEKLVETLQVLSSG